MQCINKALYLMLMMVVGSSIINADIGNHHPVLIDNSNNNDHIVNVSELISLASDLVSHSQMEFNTCSIINIVMKSFQQNNNIVFGSIYDVYNKDKINFHQKLLSNNIAISLENKPTILDLCEELYDVHFKNALNNDVNKANNILQLSLERLNNNKKEIANNIQIVKDMSQENKNKIKDYLLQNWKCAIKILNIATSHWSSQYALLNAMIFNDNTITEIKNKIQNIIINTIDYFNNEKQYLKELGIDVSDY